jgi:hypothetical protein
MVQRFSETRPRPSARPSGSRRHASRRCRRRRLSRRF